VKNNIRLLAVATLALVVTVNMVARETEPKTSLTHVEQQEQQAAVLAQIKKKLPPHEYTLIESYHADVSADFKACAQKNENPDRKIISDALCSKYGKEGCKSLLDVIAKLFNMDFIKRLEGHAYYELLAAYNSLPESTPIDSETHIRQNFPKKSGR
jgi:hypothetical protein